MNEETAKHVTQIIGAALDSFRDDHNKLGALELALKEHDPVLYGEYLNHLQFVRRNDNSGTQLEPSLERLQSLLQA